MCIAFGLRRASWLVAVLGLGYFGGLPRQSYANGFPTYYVDAANGNDANDGSSWATAKQTIQNAVDNIGDVPGNQVIVTNGVYDLGGAVIPGFTLTNRVCITKAITVRSVNGPEVTIIAGAPGSNGSNDVDAIRGVFLDGGATLSGFTITNGYTCASGSEIYDQSGGGLWMTTNCTASNVVVSGCRAHDYGGGVMFYQGGGLHNSTISGNTVVTFGGGGAYFEGPGGRIHNSKLHGNTARELGGGVFMKTGTELNNCLITGNGTAMSGGGAFIDLGGTLNNCTLSGNNANDGGGVHLVGEVGLFATVNNSIVFGNTASNAWNDILSEGNNPIRNTCASDGVTNGVNGCVTNNPLMNADFTLKAASPCHNAGNNTYAPTNVTPVDLAGNARIAFGTVDMGAYELPFVAIPDRGPQAGGNTLTITNGTFLGTITNVLLGAPSSSSATLVSSGSDWFTITLPPATNAGPVAITVQTDGNGEITLPNAYTYNQAGWIADTALAEGGSYIAAGRAHSLGVKSDGTIVAWGWNDDGQTDVPAPNTNFVAVSAGRVHSLGLKSDGTIAAWGNNGDGQTNVPSPNVDFVAVAAGYYHSLGLKSDGSVVAWGADWSGQANVPSPNTNFVAVAGGFYHSLGLKSDGTIVGWGGNDDGQTDVPLPNADFVSVAAGWYHSLGLKSNGTIVAWGSNGVGQLDVPLPNTNFVAVSALADHSLGLKSDGTIVAWGANDYGQTDVPLPNADFVAVVAGSYHSLGLKSDGSIVAWGRNEDGQTNVPAPNADFGMFTYGVLPASGSWTGGYPVVITGTNLGSGSDITNVTLGGVAAQSIVSQSATQVVVAAGTAVAAGVGDVRVFSTSFGETVKSNAFEYLRLEQAALVFSPASPQAFNTTNGLAVTGGSGTGAVSYVVSSGSGTIVGSTNLVMNAGTGTVTIVAAKAQDALYFGASTTSTVAAAKASQAITFGNPGAQVTTNETAISATSDSGLPVTFAVFSGLATLSTNTSPATVMYSGAGEVTLTAEQAGSLNYEPAPTVTNTFTVSLTPQAALVFAPASPQTYNTPNGLSATGGSGTGAVSYAVLSGPGSIVGGTNLLASSGTGVIVVEANKAADSMYLVQTASATVTVQKASQTITFGNPGAQFWTNRTALAASSTSSGVVSFAVVSGPAVLGNGTNGTYATYGGYGTVTLTADQAGSLNYEPAPTVTNSFAVVGPQLVFIGTHGAVVESGAGVSPAAGTDFGEAIIGGTALTNVFAITNAGNALLTMGTYGTNGTHGTSFRLLDVPATLAVGAVTNVTVVFAPLEGGSNTASFVFSFDGTNAPYTVNVAGVGLGGGIALETNALAFTGTFAATNPPTQLLDMTNVGVSGFTWTNSIAYNVGASNWLSVLPGDGTVPLAGAIALTNAVDIAGISVGSYTATVTIAAGDATNSPQAYAVVLTVGRASQAITFGNLGAQVTTNETAISATSDSGLPVTFVVMSGLATLSTNTSPATVTYSGAGEVVLTAEQSGSLSYEPAPTVTNTFTVSLTPQSVLVFAPASPQTYNTTNEISASGGSGTGTVSYAVVSGPGSLAGGTNLVATSGTGDIVVEATKAADSMYAVQSATATVTVARASQAIDFSNPGTQFWTNETPIAATADSGLAVQFAWVSGSASLENRTNGTYATYSGYGVVRVAASQTGDVNWAVAPTVTNTFTVVGPLLQVLGTNGAMIESSTGVSPVNGTAFGEAIIGFETVTNTFTLTNAGNATLTMGTYETNGTHASSFRLLDVPATVPAGTTAVFSVVFDPQVGGSNTASFVFSFDGTNSPYTVNVAGVGLGGGIALETNALAFTGTFAGTNPPAQLLGMTNMGVSGFSWTHAITYGAGASNWLSVVPGAGTVALGGATSLVHRVDISGLAAGAYTATVTIAAADATNSPQAYVVQLTVGRAPQTITFTNPGQQIVTNRTAITATASSGLAVGLEVVSGTNSVMGPIGPISPILLTYQKPGIVTLRATQEGNADWLAALPVDVSFRVRAKRVPFGDFNGDERSDLTVYWPLGGKWYHWYSGLNTFQERGWGWSAVTPVPRDYDGDGVVDLAVYHPARGDWYIHKSTNGKLIQRQFGWFATEPVPGDYDGDGLADLAVFHRGRGLWHIIRHDWAGYREVNFGWRETVPVPADYDGDGITDLAVYWPKHGRWHIVRSSDGRYVEGDWGFPAALPVPADYDGDGKDDLAVFCPATGMWYIQQSSDKTLREQHFGWFPCLPVPGDYDGDGKDDIAVYEPGEGRWSILQSTGGFTTRLFGWFEAQPPWSARR